MHANLPPIVCLHAGLLLAACGGACRPHTPAPSHSARPNHALLWGGKAVGRVWAVGGCGHSPAPLLCTPCISRCHKGCTEGPPLPSLLSERSQRTQTAQGLIGLSGHTCCHIDPHFFFSTCEPRMISRFSIQFVCHCPVLRGICLAVDKWMKLPAEI